MADIMLAKRQPMAPTEAERDVLRRALFTAVDGVDDSNRRSWRRFWNWIMKAEVGEVFSVETWAPRNGRFHRLHMALEQRVFDSQERFDNFEMFRSWTKIGAGHCEWLPGPKGAIIPVPKSIAYSKLDEDGFREFHANAIAFLRQPHAQKVLWPALSEAKRSECMDAILADFME